jgi:hypothetical protein
MVPSVDGLQRFTEHFPSLRVANRSDNQDLSVGGQGEGSIRANVEEIKDTAVNHES